MAEDWKAPGADEVEVEYSIVQFASGEWAIKKTEITYVAWFPTRAKAVNLGCSLLPASAKRVF